MGIYVCMYACMCVCVCTHTYLRTVSVRMCSRAHMRTEDKISLSEISKLVCMNSCMCITNNTHNDIPSESVVSMKLISYTQVEDLLGRIWLSEAVPSQIQCRTKCHGELLRKLFSEFEIGDQEWYLTAAKNVKELSGELLNRCVD
jgi:hypothetical protein